MMLIYAALLSIPDEVIEAAEFDGITGLSQFWKIKLPLILPTIGIFSILTFVGNFNAFDLDLRGAGRARRPEFLDRHPRHVPVPHLLRQPAAARATRTWAPTIATMMFLIILAGVCALSLRRPDAAAALPVLRRAMNQRAHLASVRSRRLATPILIAYTLHRARAGDRWS